VAQPWILQVLGYELRWELISHLRTSDLKVGELVAATGQAQNLVSYHLRLLRDARLVRERRSSADGRDIYYSLDRRAVTSGLLRAVEAISPGTEWVPRGAAEESLVVGRLASVLLLCTGNSARSQIAEAMLRELAGRHVLVRSAGTHPVGVHPQVQVVLESRDIGVGNLRSKSVTEFGGQAFDYVVSLCDIARTEPIQLTGKPRRVHWSIPDPVGTKGGRLRVAAAFDRVANEIELRVQDFYADLRTQVPAA
jgi:ArsR family transcriptional regulator, arsenate/arsenite/antimonite-responsive transcriptional repressor / arsenate reductase (thioredoxin)